MTESTPREPGLAGLIERVRSGLSVVSDSRRATPGGVFVALSGLADHVRDAAARGALILVTGTGQGLPEDLFPEVHRVAEPRAALGALLAARYGATRRDMRLCGLTGTNGKTTTAYLIEHLLAAAGRVPGLLGTVEYRWPGRRIDSRLTTPGCVELHALLADMAEAGATDCVMEVSSHALSQARVAGLRFDAAVFTNLTRDHLDYHPDLEAYFQAKRELFATYLKDPAGAVVNADDVHGRRLLAELPNALGYGLEPGPGGAARMLRGQIRSMSGSGIELSARLGEWTVELRSGLVGRYNAQNLLAAMGAGLALGLDPADLSALSTFQGVPGRLERVVNARGLDVFVDYAHTPDALENMLAAVRDVAKGRLVVVFGCGGDRDRVKRPQMAAAAAKWADLAVLTSDNPRTEDPNRIIDDARPGLAGARAALVEPDRRAAIGLALAETRPGDVLVVAGKGHETYQEIDGARYPFSDAEVVRELCGCA